jgi:hypothetical protein
VSNWAIISAAVIIFIGIKEATGTSNTTSGLTLAMILSCMISAGIQDALPKILEAWKARAEYRAAVEAQNKEKR